ncbi:hypothetical protein G7Y89_g14161 [Cudoniella acicularis]|uniref:Methyltransferase domain-containing protein n=1 Tax=Cudoniella acicularis TaxID=354080 RepID=A0A8H4VVD9_9HELO|nr:hypothetical protein G7Y89_g14161 [Cudoniella acicularis]
MASPLSSTTSPELTKKAVHLDQYSLEAPPPRTPSSPTTTTTTPQIITSSPSPNSQIIHRLRLVSFWDIAPGSLILEIGCGQGDTTVVLADAVGEKGHVDAIDPGPADYGAPYTLSQCQSHIKSSTPLGNRITFHNTTPTAYLSTYTGPAYDYIVLSHCIYYFANPSILPSILSSISSFGERKKEEGEKREMRLCVAEWSLSANSTTETDVRRKTPHILTALLLSLLETKRVTESQGNIRTVLSPSQITSAILSSPPPSQSQNRKWHLEAQLTLPTGDGMLDGFWEQHRHFWNWD